MSPLHSYSILLSIFMSIILQPSITSSQSHLCRSSCGDIPINYPFGIDDGCGSPYYRHMLICSDNNTKLELRTPSGKYPVKSISYSDPHLLVSDPFMWTSHTSPSPLKTTTCSSTAIQRKTATYLACIGECSVARNAPYDQFPEYGVRVDFEFPVTTKCLLCQDKTKGGRVCGFDTRTQNFLCLCKQGNVTTHCNDTNLVKHKRIGAVTGTVTAVSAAGAIGVGGGVFWYLRKVRAKAPVTCGVQSNENRIF
ncbi:hypothetical protein Bca52824_006445 [Brassica carinata]|uniref:Wall-associated receptor kinase galacturonan-binding domain-containing protein n=1 Tax=Brassica carinata TaxID=52824 RepID=A0A8X7W629_BRACI|nr:hypothetical protein Bca52824_006445 [Brassica carinata]